MNPLWFATRLAGAALLTAGGLALLARRFGPDSKQLIESAGHFKRGMEEFQKGFSAVMFGSSHPSVDEVNKRREAKRITVE